MVWVVWMEWLTGRDGGNDGAWKWLRRHVSVHCHDALSFHPVNRWTQLPRSHDPVSGHVFLVFRSSFSKALSKIDV